MGMLGVDDLVYGPGKAVRDFSVESTESACCYAGIRRQGGCLQATMQ